MNDWLCGPHQGPWWRMGRSQDSVIGLPQKHSKNIDSQIIQATSDWRQFHQSVRSS
jgi:hypothetical protein